MKKNEYKCDMCEEVNENAWTDEEAKAEATELFGKNPDEWNGGQAVVCDDCFQGIHPKDHPKELANAKKII